jgi:hypothetical protein
MALPDQPPHYLARILRAPRVIARNHTNGLRSRFVKTLLLSVIVNGTAPLEPLFGSQIQSLGERDLPAPRLALQASL